MLACVSPTFSERATRLVRQPQSARSCVVMDSQLRTTFNEFQMLANTQFFENRVTLTRRPSRQHQPQQQCRKKSNNRRSLGKGKDPRAAGGGDHRQIQAGVAGACRVLPIMSLYRALLSMSRLFLSLCHWLLSSDASVSCPLLTCDVYSCATILDSFTYGRRCSVCLALCFVRPPPLLYSVLSALLCVFFVLLLFFVFLSSCPALPAPVHLVGSMRCAVCENILGS